MTEDELKLIRRAMEATSKMPDARAALVLGHVFKARDDGRLTEDLLDTLLAER